MQSKKNLLFSGLIALLFMFGLIMPQGVEARDIIVNAGEALLYLNPAGTQPVTNDATQTLQVMVDDVVDLTAYHLELTYDPADITVTEVRNGAVLTSPTETGLFEPTNWETGDDTGTIMFGLAQQGTGGDPTPVTLTEPGVLLEIDFTIDVQGDATMTLDAAKSLLVSWPDAFEIPFIVPTGQGSVAYNLDDVAPLMTAVTPTEGLVTLGLDDTFVLTVDAFDLNLYELEIDHSFEGTLPEFSVYASEATPWGTDEDKAMFDDAGVTISYTAADQKWTINFGEAITDTYFIPNGVTFYMVLKDEAGNTWGSMSPPTGDNTYAYTFDVTNTLEEEITSAVTYEYTPPFDYTGSIDFDDTNNIFTGTYSPAEFLANGAVYDLARYLGALYRQSTSTVASIVFNSVPYTWDTTGTLLGSNWEDASGNTLVSAMTAYYFSSSYDPAVGMTVTLNDGWHTAQVTFKIIITNTLDAEIASAPSYVYDPVYTYVGNRVFDDATNLYTMTYSPAEFLAEGAMNDLARYLGALYRQSTSTIIKIEFDGVDYTWDTTGTLLGSNWEDASGNTLVSAMVAKYLAAPSDLTITVADGVHTNTVTFRLLITNTLDAEIASAPNYIYDPVYTYVGTRVFDDATNIYTVTYDDVDFNPGAMNDLARYLGALYRQTGSTVTSIVYGGVTYTWNADGTLLGSNWEDASGNTLVSAVVAGIGSYDPAVGLVFTLSDGLHEEDVTHKFVIVDTTAPTIVSGMAVGATGFDNVTAGAGLTFTVPQGYTVDHIEITLSEAVQIVAPGIVYFEGNPYGTMTATGSVVTITPNAGNEIAGIPGTFHFTIDAGSITDLAGNALATLTATMVVEPSPIFNITDFGPYVGWDGAYNLGWGYVPLFDTTTIASIEVGMLDVDLKSIMTYTAAGAQLVYQSENGYITADKLSSAPFYRVYDGNPIAEGDDLDWTVIFGEAFDAWSPRWGYVEVTDIHGTVVYHEIEYLGSLGDLIAPTIETGVAIGASGFDNVTAVDLTFTVPQGYTVDHIEFTMSEPVTVVAGTEVTLAGVPYGTITANGALITVTPYPGNTVANLTGTFIFDVPEGKIFDLSGNPLGTLSATLIVTNVAPVAVDDAYSVAEDGVLTVAARGVLTNDTDYEPTILTAVKVTDPANGTLTLNADGSFTYTPDADFSGTDNFTYKANDGLTDSNTATVTITVTPVNDAPVAVNDSYSTSFQTLLTVTAPGVLGNDTDVDGDSLAAVLVVDVNNGILALAADGSFTYTPAIGFNGVDSFTYKANDGTLDSNIVTVTITVTAYVNTPPVAVADAYETDQEVELVVPVPGVLANDYDVDGDILTATLKTNVTNGTLVLLEDGSFTYMPNPGFCGTDSFVYTLVSYPRINADGWTAEATATITVYCDPIISSDNLDGPYYVGTLQEFQVTLTNPEFGHDYTNVLARFRLEDITLADIASFQYLETSVEPDAWMDLPLAQDGTGVIGDFGPATGFPMAAPYSATSQFKVSFNTAGTYPATIVLYDVAADPDVELDRYTADVLVVDLASPVVDITAATADGVAMGGDLATGYILPTMNDPAVDHLLQINATVDEPLTNEYFGLKLISSTVSAAELKAYYAAKPVPEPYLSYLNSAADGVNPFVYIKADGLMLSLVDAARHDLGGVDVAMTVPDTFPLGTYTVQGVVRDLAGNETTVTLILIVTGDREEPVVSIIEATADGVAMGGDLATGYILPTTNDPAVDHLLQIDATVNEPLATKYNGLYFVEAESTVSTAELQAYYVARGVPTPYLEYLNGAAAGTNPFVFIKEAGLNLSLVDAAKYTIQGTDVDMTIPDDFPQGKYVVRGVVADPAGNETTVTLILIVQWTEETALEWLQGNTVLSSVSMMVDDLTATFPESIPPVIVAEDYVIDSRMTLAQALPAGTTVTVYKDGVAVLTDITLSGTGPFWFTELFDPDAPRADFDANYGGKVENYSIVVTGPGGNPLDFATTVFIESVISKDGFVTETVLDDITLGVLIPADELAALEWLQENTVLSSVSMMVDDLTATFPLSIPPVIVAEDYVIDSRMTLAAALPAGSTVTVFREGVQILTDITLSGVGPFWFTELFDPDAPRAAFDANYGGAVENYSIVVTGPAGLAADFDTTVLIESVISKDGYTNETVLDDITLGIHLDDALAPTIASGVARSDSHGDVNLVDGKFTVNQGYVVETIEITMDEDVLVDLGSVVTMVGYGPYGTITANLDGVVTITPYAGFETAALIGTFTFTVPDGSITDLAGNAFTGSIMLEVLNVAPVAVDDAYTVLEDGVLTIPARGVLINDTDFDPAILTAVVVTEPTNGTLVLNADGSFTYTPAANFNGTDTFTYMANDGHDNSNIATVTITITPVNDDPVAMDDAYETNEDTTLVVEAPGVLANDGDVDEDNLASYVLTQPAHGILTLASDGSFTYVPEPNWHGTDAFTYQLVATPVLNAPWTDDATVTITVNPVNDAPVLGMIEDATIPELVEFSFTATATDVDLPAQVLTFSLVGAPDGAAITPAGVFTWTPSELQGPGVYTFTVKVCDDASPALCDEQEVTLTVTEVNVAPVLSPIADATIPELVEFSFTATAIDADLPAQVLTFSLISAPEGASIDQAGVFTWTPSELQGPGVYTFTVKVCDDASPALCDEQEVTLTVTEVNAAPVAQDRSATTQEETPVDVTLVATDVENDTLTYAIVDQPAHGTVTLVGNLATYTPALDFVGEDSFTYKANDSMADSNVATISITVTPLNDAPVANDDEYEVDEDGVLTVEAPGVMENDTDVDLDNMVVTVVSTVSHGELVLYGDGSFTYTPEPDFYGTDSFVYQLVTYPAIQAGWTDEATVTITVRPINDAPVAQDQSVTTPEETAKAITLVATDIENDPLTYAIVAQPAHGTVVLVDNVATYTPALNYTGPDSFTFKANDGMLDSNVATVSITVTPVNDAPVAVDDEYTVAEKDTLTIAAPGILDNDSDVDGDVLTAILVDTVSNGSLTLNADGSFVYTPNDYFNGTDSFTYLTSDGTLESELAEVVITVTPVNDWPIANDDFYETITGVLLDVAAPGVLENDVLLDPDEEVSIQILDAPQHGTLSMNDDGSFTYTPDAGFMGTDTFRYQLNSVQINAEWNDDALVTIVVKPYMYLFLPIIWR